MYSTQAWAAHYGLPLNAPEDFVQGYVDAMRMDAKGQGKPCGRGFIPANKKCSSKGRQQLASDLRAGDLGAKARVERGKQNAMAQQAARRQAAGGAQPAPAQSKRSPETIAKQQATRAANKAKQQALWGSKANTPKRLQRQTVKIEEGKVRRTRAFKGRSSSSARIRQGMGLEGVSEAPKPTPSTKRKRSPEAIEKQKATRETNKARREKLWGSKANTPKRLQRQTVKIEGGKVRRTRAFKGRSSTRAKLYKPE